jgi:DNA-binding beta-propeller fold protein YncE
VLGRQGYRTWRRRIAAACVVSAGLVASAAGAARADTVGTTVPFAHVPYPNHAGGVTVDGDTVYVDTLNPLSRAPDDYDAIFSYDLRTGAMLTDRPNPIKVPRRVSPAVMGLGLMAVDAQHRLYVADMLGQILRVDPHTGAQTVYAAFPDDSRLGVVGMPTGLCFDADGNLYVTDSGSGLGVIWKIPPGGGEAKPWLIWPASGAVYPSTATLGIAIDPSRSWIYFSSLYQSAAAVYRVPLNRPETSAVELVHAYSPPVAAIDPKAQELHGWLDPTAIAFGQSGKLYVSLAADNQVSVLRPDGTEERRFPTAAQNAAQQVPYDDPLGIAFGQSGSLLVANTVLAPTDQHSYVLSASVGDSGLPLLRPSIGDQPAVSATGQRTSRRAAYARRHTRHRRVRRTRRHPVRAAALHCNLRPG